MRRTVACLHRARDPAYKGEWDLEPSYRDLEIWLNDDKVWAEPGGFIVPKTELTGVNAQSLDAHLERPNGRE
eukprot:2317116-Prorocentrum_lima.AAC.1